jgi:hypothetical protein
MAALTNCGHAQCAGMLLLDFRKWDIASTHQIDARALKMLFFCCNRT